MFPQLSLVERFSKSGTHLRRVSTLYKWPQVHDKKQ